MFCKSIYRTLLIQICYYCWIFYYSSYLFPDISERTYFHLEYSHPGSVLCSKRVENINKFYIFLQKRSLLCSKSVNTYKSQKYKRAILKVLPDFIRSRSADYFRKRTKNAQSYPAYFSAAFCSSVRQCSLSPILRLLDVLFMSYKSFYWPFRLVFVLICIEISGNSEIVLTKVCGEHCCPSA